MSEQPFHVPSASPRSFKAFPLASNFPPPPHASFSSTSPSNVPSISPSNLLWRGRRRPGAGCTPVRLATRCVHAASAPLELSPRPNVLQREVTPYLVGADLPSRCMNAVFVVVIRVVVLVYCPTPCMGIELMEVPADCLASRCMPALRIPTSSWCWRDGWRRKGPPRPGLLMLICGERRSRFSAQASRRQASGARARKSVEERKGNGGGKGADGARRWRFPTSQRHTDIAD